MFYLNVLNDVSERRGAVSPCPHQHHGLIKVPDIVRVHPQEGCVPKQNITQAWALTPTFSQSGKVRSKSLPSKTVTRDYLEKS